MMAEAKDRFNGGVDAARLVLTRKSAGGKLRARRDEGGQKANRAALPAASAAKGERHPAVPRKLRGISAVGNIAPSIALLLITALDLDAKARQRLNSGVRSVLLKETFRPAGLVERIRRLADKRAATNTVQCRHRD